MQDIPLVTVYLRDWRTSTNRDDGSDAIYRLLDRGRRSRPSPKCVGLSCQLIRASGEPGDRERVRCAYDRQLPARRDGDVPRNGRRDDDGVHTSTVDLGNFRYTRPVVPDDIAASREGEKDEPGIVQRHARSGAWRACSNPLELSACGRVPAGSWRRGNVSDRSLLGGSALDSD